MYTESEAYSCPKDQGKIEKKYGFPLFGNIVWKRRRSEAGHSRNEEPLPTGCLGDETKRYLLEIERVTPYSLERRINC